MNATTTTATENRFSLACRFCGEHIADPHGIGCPAEDTMPAEERWKFAVKVIRKNGIRFRQNVQSCCRGCVGADTLGMKSEDEPVIWTFGGQGNAVVWEDGVLRYRSSRFPFCNAAVTEVFFNHSNLDTATAERVVGIFRECGFDARWDGSNSSCITVHFDTKNA